MGGEIFGVEGAGVEYSVVKWSGCVVACGRRLVCIICQNRHKKRASQRKRTRQGVREHSEEGEAIKMG